MANRTWRSVLAGLLAAQVFGCAATPVVQPFGGMAAGEKVRLKSLSTPHSRFSKRQLLVRQMGGQPAVPGVRIRGSLGAYQVHELPREVSVDQAIETYRHSASVLSVEKLEQVDATPPAEPKAAPAVPTAPAPRFASNDPLLYQQWSHAASEVPQAWKVTKGRDDVLVAVIDSGVDYTHPDLAGRVVNGPDFGEGKDPRDIDMHGTHVAGIIAAAADNGIGVAGVAPGARILNLKMTYPVFENGTFEDMTYDEFTLAKAVQYAATQGGAKVINISYGLVSSELVASMIDFARGRGLIICVSAGNRGSNLYTGESKYQDGVFAVHAVDPQNRIASFSNFGNIMGIAAPGDSIMSTVPTYPNPFTGEKYGKAGYDYAGGTSMASPFVAGVAALAVSALVDAGNKALEGMGVTRRLKPADVPGRLVEDLLRATCFDLGRPGRDETYGAGLVNAKRAAEAAVSDRWIERLLTETRVDRRR